MRKFVHLRGCMGCGKTSTARAFISRGNFSVYTINIAGKDYPYTYDPERKWLVTGRYDTRVCGGMDGVISNRDLMRIYLKRLMKEVSPDVIVFEAVMYGCTFDFASKLNEICKSLGYEYRGILLFPDFDKILSNIRKRNGGKPINEKGLFEQWSRSLAACNKLKEAGIYCDIVDSSDYSLDSLAEIVEERIK